MSHRSISLTLLLFAACTSDNGATRPETPAPDGAPRAGREAGVVPVMSEDAAPPVPKDAAPPLNLTATADASAPEAAPSAPDGAPAGMKRTMLSLLSGRIEITDVDGGHAKLRTVTIAGGDYKGIAAHAGTDRLYITSRTGNRLFAYRLSSLMEGAAAQVVYDKVIACPYPDSLAVTADGQELYVPCRDGRKAVLLEAETAAVKAEFDMSTPFQMMTMDRRTQSSPHNAWVGTRHAYIAALANPTVLVIDLATRKPVRRVGPFSQTIRPFTVAPDESRAFVNIDGTLGFGVGDVATGKVLEEVKDMRPASRTQGNAGMYHLTPSHGIAMRPGTQEIWFTNDAWGFLHVWDVATTPAKKIADVPLFDTPAQVVRGLGWVTFDPQGRFAFAASGAVVDAATKKKVAQIAETEFRLAVTFSAAGKPVEVGRRMY